MCIAAELAMYVSQACLFAEHGWANLIQPDKHTVVKFPTSVTIQGKWPIKVHCIGSAII